MENSAIQLTCGGLEEVVTSATTPSETLSFHTALEECSLSSSDEVALGDPSSTGSSMEQKSEYFSSRVKEMMDSKSQFSSDVEREIEHSRVHWSELSGFPNLSEDKDDGEDLDEEDSKVYSELVKDPSFGKFFMAWVPAKWKLGRKIAEGAQAEIFEVLDGDTVHAELLFKVFKRGPRLSDLRKKWPDGIFRREVPCVVGFGVKLVRDGGRFAFGMKKCWGDLRKLIDEAMQEKKNQGPPFPYNWNGHTLLARGIMMRIAVNMKNLHVKGIIHRDLKAANILLHIEGEVPMIIVADFECSIGILGTRFWRAPELLLDLKKKKRTIDFSEKMDVYSYGMTCFEVVTGHLPFEGELKACRASYDLIIEGRRPKLPSDLNVTLKDLIERCWNPIPNERPSFSEIVEVLESS